ncbi:hypothetical protein [Crocosphaera sp. Alani8]|uniref:hypothetical protein n=1 Tax=Crocosphaera sp. Alani8 TaxID=3038952 RepID=UPI00313C24B4
MKLLKIKENIKNTGLDSECLHNWVNSDIRPFLSIKEVILLFRLSASRLSQLAVLTGFIALASSYCALPAYGDVNPEVKAAYQEALKDAEVPEYGEIYQKLTAITENNSKLVWEGEPGKSRLKVVTWTNYDGYKLNQKEPQAIDMWVTVYPKLKNFCTQYVASGGTNLSLRLKQLLGLNPNWQYKNIVEMWVEPQFLFRPSADPEISDREAELISPVSNRFTKIEKKHQDWLIKKRGDSFQKNENGIYNDDAQPWTALGYTYDWGNPETEVGLSEFVIENNENKDPESSFVEVVSITPIAIRNDL